MYEVIINLHNTEVKPKSPLIKNWLNELWYIHAMEFYAFYSQIWKDLQDTSQEEISRKLGAI